MTRAGTSMTSKQFAAGFTKAVHAGLEATIGRNEAESTLFHLQVGKGYIDPAEFHLRLVKLFREEGAALLEREIALELVRRLDLPLAALLEVLDSQRGFDFLAIVYASERILSGNADAHPLVSARR